MDSSSNLDAQNKTQKKSHDYHKQQSKLEKQQSTSNIFSLTLEEFQQNMANNKNLGSMNMDEFLYSIYNNNDEDGNYFLSQNPLAEPKALPPTLSLKTVDEVWSEIYPAPPPPPRGGYSEVNDNSTQRQATFGEMTLEDFLVRAGVVREGNNNNTGSSSNAVKNHLAGQKNYPDQKYDEQQPVSMGGRGDGVSDNTDSVNGGGGGGGGDMPNSGMYVGVGGSRIGKDVVHGAGVYFGNQVGQIQSKLETGRGMWRGSKRCRSSRTTDDDDGGGGPVEKVVERRQRRMIKNREAASRSRARKQAYTVELEAALDHLKEENARLSRTLVREMEGLKGKHFGKAHATTTPAANMKMLGRMWSLPLISCLTN